MQRDVQTFVDACVCVWVVCNMPYEPRLARAPGAHERAVRRGPDPV
jgi:hypothetical protein